MGLCGLLVAKVLRLPVTTTSAQGEAFSALVKPLAGNALVERAAQRYLAWFYAGVEPTAPTDAGAGAAPPLARQA